MLRYNSQNLTSELPSYLDGTIRRKHVDIRDDKIKQYTFIIPCVSSYRNGNMGPNITDIEEKCNLQNNILQAALPYKEPNYQEAKDEKENASSEVPSAIPSVSDDLEDGDALRIATRSRYSYELDRYSKNAMLIFEGNSSDIALENHVDDADSSTEDITLKFKQTFEQYRFEVEIFKDLSDDEIASTCDRFFQRDFTEYGCVAVMMLAKTRQGLVESSHTPNSEYGVLRYLTDLSPPTLQDKPKIYIVQTEGYYLVPRARVWSQPPWDFLEFRLPVPIVSAPDTHGKRSKICCLLEYVYEKINSMADQLDLFTILADSVEDFSVSAPVLQLNYTVPVIHSSLAKELRLARAPQP